MRLEEGEVRLIRVEEGEVRVNEDRGRRSEC